MKRLVIVLIVVAVVAGGAYVAYTMGYLPDEYRARDSILCQ